MQERRVGLAAGRCDRELRRGLRAGGGGDDGGTVARVPAVVDRLRHLSRSSTKGTRVGVLGFVAVAAGCSGALAPGNAETDRIASVVSDAISHPRQESAAGYARAALATRAGQDGRLRVIEIEELQADERGDPFGRLVFLIHLEGSEAGWTISRPVTACYRAEFGFYGVIGGPRRMVCPPDPTPITPPSTRPTPEIAIPDGADEVVEQVLTAAAPTPRADDIRGALGAALSRTSPDTLPGRRPLPPTPQVATDGSDIGVALAEPDDHSCLLGARIDGTVLVWRPSRVQVQPGELSCEPGTALARQGMRPPH
jgi:hypothetical protein